MNKQPLAGKTILITRAREQSGEFGARLRNLGAEVIGFPTIEIVPPRSWAELDRAIDQLASYHWVIFTSVNGVDFFWKRLVERKKEPVFPSSLKVCAIGPATGDRLKQKGIPVDYTPKEYIAEAILEGFKRVPLEGRRILLARVKTARDVLPKGLRQMGAEVDVVEAYRTVKPRGGSRSLEKILTDHKIDVIAFTSSSTVNHFVALLKRKDWKRLLRPIAIACIGPVTAKTAMDWGMEVAIQPQQFTIPALTQDIVDSFSPRLRRKSVEGRESK